jgi:tetratricopeptide (TPR) repeat protein
MNLPKLARIALCAALLVFSSSAVLAKKSAKAENEYPNATRSEPKTSMSASESRDLSKAADLVNDGENDKALPLIEKVLAGRKVGAYAQAFAQQLLGRVYWDQEQEEPALAATSKAIELDALPNNAHFGLMYQLAQMQVQTEKYADALKTLDRFKSETGVENPDQIALLGNIYYRLEKYQEAADTMKRAIAASSEPKESWNQILMASLFELDQYGEAAKVIQGQLAKTPDDIKLIKQLATVYINDDKYPQAIEVLSKAKEKGLITSQEDYVQLAKLYANAEKPKESAATLKEGIASGKVTPDYEVNKLLGDVCGQAEDEACAMTPTRRPRRNRPTAMPITSWATCCSMPIAAPKPRLPWNAPSRRAACARKARPTSFSVTWKAMPTTKPPHWQPGRKPRLSRARKPWPTSASRRFAPA